MNVYIKKEKTNGSFLKIGTKRTKNPNFKSKKPKK